MARRIVIGDIHGTGQELGLLLEKIAPAHDDRLYATGDMLDKGMCGDDVWRLLHRHKFTCVAGNHEVNMKWFMLGKLRVVDSTMLLTLNQLHAMGVSPEELVAWLRSLPLLHIEPDLIVVHAGVCLDRPCREDRRTNAFAFREWWTDYDGRRLVVYGHKATKDSRPRVVRKRRGSSVGIDTGAVYGRGLSAVCVETREVWHVPSENGHRAAKLASTGMKLNADYRDFIRRRRVGR